VVKKFAPRNNPDFYFYWNCNRVEIILADRKKIFAYQYLSGPEYIYYKGKNYSPADIDFPKTKDNFNKKFDISYNCFGYAFFDRKLWFEPYEYSEENPIENKCMIELLLQYGNYNEINIPLPNAIALFIKHGKFNHSAKTLDGKLWLAKEGINKGILKRSLKYNIKKFGEVKFFLRELQQ